ncbi:hypothetical protein LTS17_006134 [Exophiala oligosperma]
MPPIILFNSSTTVIGRRLDWYLTIRGVPFYLCQVDNVMPRPVLGRLGVRYRRIPILAVGRDVYCDSRCIIRMLEERYTGTAGTTIPRLGADPTAHPYEAAIERVLETWALEVLFLRTGSLVTYDYFVAQSREFIEDRKQLTGWTTTKEGMAEKIPDAQTSTRITLEILDGMLSDGRQFLGTVDDRQRPGLADVHVGWVFDWLYRGQGKGSMKNAYPELLDQTQNARVVAWVKRINEVVEDKKKQKTTSHSDNSSSGRFPLYPIRKIDEDQAVKMIEEAEFWEEETLQMVRWDPTNLQNEKGVEVDLYTTDLPSGFRNKDTGELVGLTAEKVTIVTKTKNGVSVRIHYPRSNVKVARAKSML